MESLAHYQTTQLAPDRLIVNASQILTAKKGLASGTLTRGDIVGRVAAAVTAAAAAGNTGNGTIGTLSTGAGVKIGVYTAICIEPASNLGTFQVEDPDGVIVGRAIVGTAFTGAVNFTIADGATDFVAGDRFLITVPDSGNVKLCAAASTDGSARPWGIVATGHDASEDPQEVLVYTRGDFNEAAVTLGAGLTTADVRDVLRARGIALIPSMGV
jgi:hypothetical protein